MPFIRTSASRGTLGSNNEAVVAGAAGDHDQRRRGRQPGSWIAVRGGGGASRPSPGKIGAVKVTDPGTVGAGEPDVVVARAALDDEAGAIKALVEDRRRRGLRGRGRSAPQEFSTEEPSQASVPGPPKAGPRPPPLFRSSSPTPPSSRLAATITDDPSPIGRADHVLEAAQVVVPVALLTCWRRG